MSCVTCTILKVVLTMYVMVGHGLSIICAVMVSLVDGVLNYVIDWKHIGGMSYDTR